jgi:hypothetical protein
VQQQQIEHSDLVYRYQNEVGSFDCMTYALARGYLGAFEHGARLSAFMVSGSKVGLPSFRFSFTSFEADVVTLN